MALLSRWSQRDSTITTMPLFIAMPEPEPNGTRVNTLIASPRSSIGKSTWSSSIIMCSSV